jgi:hypothetical protein
MSTTTRSLVGSAIRVALVVAALSAAACADAATAPTIAKRAKAATDSTTTCRGGFIIIDGRTVCSDV